MTQRQLRRRVEKLERKLEAKLEAKLSEPGELWAKAYSLALEKVYQTDRELLGQAFAAAGLDNGLVVGRETQLDLEAIRKIGPGTELWQLWDAAWLEAQREVGCRLILSVGDSLL